MDDLKVQLTQAYKDGNFFEFIREIYYQDRKDEKLLPGILTELHNQGQLNLVELFHSFRNKTANHDNNKDHYDKRSSNQSNQRRQDS